MGRPKLPASERKTPQIWIRCTPAQKELLDKHAAKVMKSDGRGNTSTWALGVLLAEACRIVG